MHCRRWYCFYGSISFWIDCNTDQRHEELRVKVNNVIELYLSAFQPFLFSSDSVEAHLRTSKVVGTWAKTLDIIACATLEEKGISVFAIVG